MRVRKMKTSSDSRNIDIVKRIYESFSAGDIEAVTADWDVSIALQEPDGFATGGGTHHGPEEILTDVFARLRTRWTDVSVVPERFVDGGDTIVMLGNWRGTYIETGKTASFPLAHVFDLRDGKIVKWQSYADTALYNAAVEA